VLFQGFSNLKMWGYAPADVKGELFSVYLGNENFSKRAPGRALQSEWLYCIMKPA